MANRQRWNWRAWLTPGERDIIQRAEKAKKEWMALNGTCAGIRNRATQRAKFHDDRAVARAKR